MALVEGERRGKRILVIGLIVDGENSLNVCVWTNKQTNAALKTDGQTQTERQCREHWMATGSNRRRTTK